VHMNKSFTTIIRRKGSLCAGSGATCAIASATILITESGGNSESSVHYLGGEG
jgi:hypothetical protein